VERDSSQDQPPGHHPRPRPSRPTRRRPRALGVDRRELAAIFAGGALGALARSGLAQALPFSPDRWPWATFAVNVAGAAVLGYLITRLQERVAPTVYGRALLGTGFCGALTTFSTMIGELERMLARDRWALAGGYALASIACGLAAVFVSTKLVRRARLAS
jgi:CrcB protein